jgi:16S rRNA C967 or C1407 C5-methylase (RsmB/RsmF family)/NOL1/NOP2/fmu family ribosome biogenesis protein
MVLPQSFIDEIKHLLGDEESQKLFEAIGKDQEESIRMNVNKTSCLSSPIDVAEKYERVPWCTSGFYLNERLTYTFDPLFHAGVYYVQEASSMFLSQVLNQYVGDRNVKMLDLCAAPGGKSTLARSTLSNDSLLVVNEVVRNRAQVLAENMTKWGHDGVVVTGNEPADFVALGGFFDVILTDVPCSGEGMFRKDAKAVTEWSVENVDNCWSRQREILRDIWPSLKEGGLLIYSTCTFNTKEDEENVQWIVDELGAESLPVKISSEWSITGNLMKTDTNVYRFLPGRTRGEGFFMAALRKTSYAEPVFSSGKSKKNTKPALAVPANMKLWLKNPDEYTFDNDGESITAVSTLHANDVALISKVLRVMQAGVKIAEVKGKDFVPSQALAMCVNRKEDAFPVVELAYDRAIAYLRRESLILPAEAPKGYVIVTYRGAALGFVKNLGNRANNLYTQEWRIRSGYMPLEVKCL